MSVAIRSLTMTAARAATATPRTAAPTNAAVASSGESPPSVASRKTAITG
jgi:hypothetical protein